MELRDLELKAKAFGYDLDAIKKTAEQLEYSYEDLLATRVEQYEENIRVNQFWNAKATEMIGKKIVQARYMTKKEAEEMGWYKRPIVLVFDDGSLFYPRQDDEGNDGGALFGQDKDGNEMDYPVL
jgi:hypothetical protein